MNINVSKSVLLFVLLAAIVVFAVRPAVAAPKTYTMKEGDTLWDLAAKYYNDPTLYPVFLEINKIDNPRTIPVGKVIVIPSFEEMKKVANEPDPVKRKNMVNTLSSGLPVGTSSSTAALGENVPSNKPIDPKSVSIIKIMGGQNLNPQSIKDDKSDTSSQNP